VRLVQPASGPRTTTDPIFLADFIVRSCGLRPRRACDLGAGTGVLGLLLATLDPRVAVVGIELQPELARLAAHNAAQNGLASRVRCECADLRALGAKPARAPFDLVLSNPPYHEAASGRVSSDRTRALAHHELGCSLGDVLATASRLLTPRGALALIYPAPRLQDLVTALLAERFRLRFLRMLHPRAGRPAARVLVLAQRSRKARLSVLPPLFLHEGTGWAAEAAAILDGATADSRAARR